MPLYIVRNDIVKMRTDAIVTAADRSLRGSGGADGCIHRAAGPALDEACRRLGGCEVGQAKLTGGYALPCRYVIHTVGPRWQGGHCGEAELLSACYRNALALAKAHDCETIAFPLIASGVYGCPKELALRIAVDTISAFLQNADMTVYLVVFDRASYRIGSRLYADIAAYIDDRYAEAHTDTRRRNMMPLFGDAIGAACGSVTAAKLLSLDDALRGLDESFTEMLLRKIDERGMTDAECYKKANISRKLFSKIRSDRQYRPSKPTAIAFALALELPYDEMTDMLRKAGFALSHSNKFDIIIEYFVQNGIYNIMEINEALFAFDQNLLGT